MKRDLRSPEFRSALQDWLDDFEVGLVRFEPGRELREEYDDLLDGFDRFWTLLENTEAEEGQLESLYRSLQRQSHRLSEELWAEAGPTPLGWLNQTLQLVKSFLDHGGPRPETLGPVLNGQAAWLRLCGLFEDFATQLSWLADWSEGARQSTAQELTLCLERLRDYGLRHGHQLRASYSNSLYSGPSALEPFLKEVDRLLSEVETKMEGQQLHPRHLELLESGYEELTELEEEAENWLQEGVPGCIDDWASRLHKVVEKVDRAEVAARSATCGVCGQWWVEGDSKCRFCGSRNQQEQSDESRYQVLVDLDQALERFEAGYSDNLEDFLRGALDKLEQALKRLPRPQPKLEQSLAKMREGYLLLLEVSQPGDPRLGRGRELVHLGADELAHLT